jgi:hypothetical protein
MSETINSFEIPQVKFVPKSDNKYRKIDSALVCTNGWDEKTTQAFLSNDFEELHLWMRPNLRMDIPLLGEKALCVKSLSTHRSGIITGLDQFQEIGRIHIDSIPQNGINFGGFEKLRHISTTWDKKLSNDVFKCRILHELDVYEGFSDEDCQKYRLLPQLTHVGFTQGRLKNLKGLEACPDLESLRLVMVRGLVDLLDLAQFKNLRSLTLDSLPRLKWTVELTDLKELRTLHLEKLPALQGTISLSGLTFLEDICIVESPNAIVDLSAISDMPNLRKLWLNKPHINLDLDALFSRKFIKLFQCKELGDLAESDETLIKRAEQHGRNITQITRPGPKKSRAVTIFFDHYEKRGMK